MKLKRKLFHSCLNLHKTSESIGYCSYYGEIINFCPKNCPNNYPVRDSRESNLTKGNDET